MKLFQAWVQENAETNEIAAYNSELLIIGMSATALESEQEAAFDYGMHFFCPKPANMDVLGLMIEAKRQCRNNEDALDMICEATGTDIWTGPPDILDSSQEFGDLVGESPRTSPSVPNLASLDSPSRTDSGPGNFGTEVNSPGGRESTKDSERSSLPGSGKGSDRDSGKEGSTADGDTLTSGVAGAAGLPGISSSGSVGSMGAASGSAHAVKTVTDSKSAAMWSVFRSYRQSTRNAAASLLGDSSRRHSFPDAQD
jgi:hypothetical protein